MQSPSFKGSLQVAEYCEVTWDTLLACEEATRAAGFEAEWTFDYGGTARLGRELSQLAGMVAWRSVRRFALNCQKDGPPYGRVFVQDFGEKLHINWQAERDAKQAPELLARDLQAIFLRLHSTGNTAERFRRFRPIDWLGRDARTLWDMTLAGFLSTTTFAIAAAVAAVVVAVLTSMPGRLWDALGNLLPA